MIPGFQGPLVASTTDGKNWTLVQPLIYVTGGGVIVHIPIGSTTDGPSIPAAVTLLIPNWGPIFLPAAFHDLMYRIALMAKSTCDEFFLEAMRINGVPELEAQIVYKAVVLGGAHAYNEDKAKHDAAKTRT